MRTSIGLGMSPIFGRRGALTPTTVNLVAHHDAALGVTDNSGVELWEDQSASGNDYSQSDIAKRPAYTGGATPYISASGGADHHLAGPALLDGADGYTAFYVIETTTTNAGALRDSVSGARGNHVIFSGDRFSWRSNLGGGNVESKITIPTTKCLVCARYDRFGATDNDRARIWLDGVEQAVTHSGTVPNVAVAEGPAMLLNRSAQDQGFLGRLYEAREFDRALTEDEINLLNTTLALKHGI